MNCIKDVFRFQTNEIRDSPLLAVFIDLLLGKGPVYTQPEQLEPAPVSFHNGREPLQSANMSVSH